MPTNNAAKSVIHRELSPLGQGNVLHSDPKEISTSNAVLSYAILNFLDKRVEERKKVLKAVLMPLAETRGIENDKGHRELEVGQEKIIRERKQSAGPNEDKLKTLLATKGIDMSEVYDEVKTVVLNPSKLEFLVSVGKLDKEEVEALRDESFSLKVVEGPELKALLKAACEQEVEEPATPKRTRK
jgi:hypothetical protein